MLKVGKEEIQVSTGDHAKTINAKALVAELKPGSTINMMLKPKRVSRRLDGHTRYKGLRFRIEKISFFPPFLYKTRKIATSDRAAISIKKVKGG